MGGKKKAKKEARRKIPKTDDEYVQLSADYHAALDEISAIDNPRVTAILGVSMLDALLERALRTKLIPLSSKMEDAVFGPKGPLGPMSQKIDMGHALALYDKEVRADLILLNRIRNRFAHHLDIHSFEHPDIDKLMREVRFPKLKKTAALMGFFAEEVERLPLDDSNHTNFLFTVAFISLGLETWLKDRPPALPPETTYGLAY